MIVKVGIYNFCLTPKAWEVRFGLLVFLVIVPGVNFTPNFLKLFIIGWECD